MAYLGATFRPEDAPEDEFSLLPDGDHLMQVIESDVEPTKNGTGTVLKLVFEIMDGPDARRRVWERLNIVNSNATAQGIAQRALAELVQAVGLASIDDSAELHFKPLMGTIYTRKGEGQYRDQNGVKKFRQAGAAPAPRPSASAPRQTAAPAAPAVAAAKSARPWGNRTA